MLKKLLILLTVLLSALQAVNAKVKLPALVGENMVLQQRASVNVWGWSKANAMVKISPSWCPAVKTRADKNGNWLAVITTPAATFNAQSITISDGEPLTLKNILIGEVWLCSGQSNMEIPVQGGHDCPIENSQEIVVESAAYPDIRLFSVKIDGGFDKKDDVTGSWQAAAPAVVKKFSAVGYLFGYNLRKALNVPIGIINSSCGGSWIEAWFPADMQRNFKDFDTASVRRIGGNGFNTAELLYNGMIYPLHNYTIKGFVWYQGESNVGRANQYADKMAALINNWREIWGGGKKPFYYVEIPPYNYGETNEDGVQVREQQAKVMAMVENTGMVCTNDLIYDYEKETIHPSQKIPVAQRLSYWALSKDYGFGDAIEPIGPTFKAMEVKDGVVKVSFNNCEGFIIKGDIPGFELAGADMLFHPAVAVRRRPDATVLYVSCYAVAKPVAVRYNFKNCSVGSLWDTFGQPVVPFRSDSFPLMLTNRAH
jgi:sialate O-acetylesterase